MVRDLTAKLWSNTLSTPVFVEQDASFREGAVIGSVTVESERHTLKFGGDLRLTNIRENFRFAEPDELPDFDVDLTASKRRRKRRHLSRTIFAWGTLQSLLG